MGTTNTYDDEYYDEYDDDKYQGLNITISQYNNILLEIQNIKDKYNFVRRERDEKHEDSVVVQMYNDLIYVEKLINDLKQ